MAWLNVDAVIDWVEEYLAERKPWPIEPAPDPEPAEDLPAA